MLMSLKQSAASYIGRFALVQYSAISGNGDHLPRNELPAVLQCGDSCVFEAAAAGNFHSHDGNALYIVSANDLRQLFGIVYII